MLLLAVVALIDAGDLRARRRASGLPQPDGRARQLRLATSSTLSLVIAIVLIGAYVAGLIFSLRTHRDLFNPRTARSEHEATSRGACAAR